jgi:hypothetical protein
VALGQPDANSVPPAGGQHAAQARAADVPGARAAARDAGPRRREDAAPRETAADLTGDVERHSCDEQAGVGAGEGVE